MSRIAAGALKGFPLAVPRQIRATQEKVRQALFNILGELVVGSRVLDGFAGSGAIGLEALSRGARDVVFLEAHPASVRALRDNLAALPAGAVPGTTELIAGDALRSLRRLGGAGRRFDLIVLDPPYEGLWAKNALIAVGECGMLSPIGTLVVEHARQGVLPDEAGSLIRVKQHRYGDTVLSFYQQHSCAPSIQAPLTP